jgi:LysM repeat protein
VGGNRVHQVRVGDNLTRIAAQHGVSIADLAEINGLKETTMLRPGQTLNIPAKPVAPVRTAALTTPRPEAALKKPEPGAAAKSAPAAGGAKTYVVKKGDNPVAIARKLNVSYDELLKVNKIDDPKKLKPDQVLKVPPTK